MTFQGDAGFQQPPGYPPPQWSVRPPPSNNAWIVWLVVAVVAVPVVVAVLGIVAAIAIPAFLSYVREAKISRAEQDMVQLREQVQLFCRSNGRLPGPAGPLPPAPGAHAEAVRFSDDPVFAELGFAPAPPVEFSYQIEQTSPETLRVVARGDLDGDLLTSEFWYSCRLDGCQCDPVLSDRDRRE